MCLLVTPLGESNERKVGGSREAAGAVVGRLSPPALPTLVWLPAALQSEEPPGSREHVHSGKYI